MISYSYQSYNLHFDYHHQIAKHGTPKDVFCNARIEEVLVIVFGTTDCDVRLDVGDNVDWRYDLIDFNMLH